MGSSSSKAVKTTGKLSASNTARKYPTRSPPPSSNRTNLQPKRQGSDVKLGTSVRPEVRENEKRDTGITHDSSSPDLALNARLRTLGPVQPNPTHSNTSTFNNPSSILRSPNLSTTKYPLSSPSSSSLQTHQPPHQHSHQDPSLSHTQFQPSPSNPSQSIFPPSHPSQNPAVSLLTARYRLAAEAEKEFAGLGKKGSEGRGFLDVLTLRQVLVLRERGVREEEIERRMELRRGTVGRLGRAGVVGVVGLGEE